MTIILIAECDPAVIDVQQGLAYAATDSAPAYPRSFVAESVSWKAPLEQNLLQAAFPCFRNAYQVRNWRANLQTLGGYHYRPAV